MGRAKIVSHIADGEYSVIYYHDMTKINLKILKIEEAVISTDAAIATMEITITQEQENVSLLADEVDALIVTFNICLDANVETLSVCNPQKAAVKKKNIEYILLLDSLGASNKKLDNLKIKLEQLKKDLISYAGLTREETMNIWGIDLCDRPPADPDNNHGEIIPNDTIVGTVDIFDFSTRKYHINIRAAAYTRDPGYNGAFDGEAGHSLASDGNGFVYNYNMRGPQATWHPKYRLAIINSIAEGVAEVTYNALKDLDGVKFNTMDHLADSAVPVDYMVCSNRPPFEAGDQVVVSFAGDKMLSPSIIGYYTHPQPCVSFVELYFCPAYALFAGWGTPFYSGEPPAAIDPPYGTELLDSNSSPDERHKVASIGPSSIDTIFAKQKTEMPGNVYWTDNEKTLSWWGVPAAGNVDSPCNGEYCTAISVGDLLVTRPDTASPRQHYIAQYLKTGGVCTGSSYYLADMETRFGLDKIGDINNHFWVNGVKHTLTTFHAGGYGRWVVGAGMIGDWIVYSDVTINTPGGSDIVPVAEYCTAYNTVTHETRVLGVTTAYASDPNLNTPNQPINMNRTYYSQNGLHWITQRNTDQPSGNNYVNWVRGSITLDGSGDPIVCSISIGTDDFTMGGFFYGYKDNTEVTAWNYTPVTDNYARFTHIDADKDFAFGYHLQYRVGCWDLTEPRSKRYSATNVILKMGNKIWIYPVNQSTGVPDIATKPHSYTSWEGLVNGLDLDSMETFGSPYGAVMTGIGALVSIGRLGFFDGSCFQRQHYHINKLIALDGTVTDLGETLLTTDVDGELLSVLPMIVGHV